MPRPIWKGNIAFGLVNIPIILYSAEKKFDIQFKLIDSRDKAKIHYVRINENTGEEVPWEDIAKGYEYNEHNFVLLTEEDFKKMEQENARTINIEGFVDKNSLNFMDFEKPYYITPDKKGDKGYVILREALRDTNMVGITQVVIHTRQYLAALMPYHDALVLILMRYQQELRKPEEFELPETNEKKFKITAKEKEIANQLVKSMKMKWKPEQFHDEFREKLEKFIEEKLHKVPKTKRKKKEAEETKPSNVINFVDLLKKSLKKKGAEKMTSKTKTRKRKT